MENYGKPYGEDGLYIEKNERDSDFYDLYYTDKYNRTTLIAIIFSDYMEMLFDLSEHAEDNLSDGKKVKLSLVEEEIT